MTDPGEGGPGDVPLRTVVLVGFMAAGKTTVGAALAAELGWDFVDVDEEVVRRAGRTIPEIFNAWGEARFRALEEELTRQAVSRAGRVVATGGGWAARPDRIRSLPEGTLSVWLRIRPEAVLARAAGSEAERPLLPRSAAAAERVRELLAEREPYYAAADLHLDTEGADPLELARVVIEYLERGPTPSVPEQ